MRWGLVALFSLAVLCLGCGGDDDDNDSAGAGAAGATGGGGSAGMGATCLADSVCDSSCENDPDCPPDAAAAGTGGQNGQSGAGGTVSCAPSCAADQFCNRASGICVALDLDWVAFSGGIFQMGSDRESREQPIHTVTVPAFEITRTEVTASQYAACFDSGACSLEPLGYQPYHNWEGGRPKTGRENHPVNTVDWFAATDFCQWAGGRLTTEAEWEYAAKSCGRDITYPWGDERATCQYAVMMNETSDGCGAGTTMEVCSKPAGNTEQGLCDMAGNVAEWVEDDFEDHYEGAPTDGSARIDTPRSSARALRGGGFRDVFRSTTATYRTNPGAINPGADVGIRCAR